LEPTSTIGIGSISGPTCLVLSSVVAAPGATPQLSGTATVAGNFCVAVSDAGTLVQPVNYTIDLIHS